MAISHGSTIRRIPSDDHFPIMIHWMKTGILSNYGIDSFNTMIGHREIIGRTIFAYIKYLEQKMYNDLVEF